MGTELVLVDDGSRDRTAKVAGEIGARDPRVRLVRLARNFGQTPAMRAGFDAARGDVEVSMDGDLQNDPRDIPKLLERLEAGYDLVAGRLTEVERTQDPVRVLIACDHIDHEGALHGGGRQLIELVRELQRRSTVEPTVCILRSASDLGDALVAEGLPLEFLGDHRLNPISLFKLIRRIRAARIDVLHLTDFGASTFGRIAGRLTGRPVIVQIITHHSKFQPRGYPRYVEAAFRALAPWTNRALAISPTVREFAVDRMGFSRESVEVLPYPLPKHSFKAADPARVATLRTEHGIPSGAPVVGAVTRFHRAKGIEYLISAWPRVLEEIPGAYLVLVGQGPLEGELRGHCRDLGVESSVVFAGFQRDAAAYVQVFDVAAVPSVEEGFGLVALEALALGRPVVASRTGGLPDIVEDGVCGRLVPAADSRALAAALIELLADPDTRSHMGERGRERSQCFGLDRYVDRFEAIYHELRTEHP